MSPACCPSGSWPQLLATSNEDLNKDDAPAPKGEILSVPVEGQDKLPIYYVNAAEGKATKGSIMVLPDIYSVRALLPHVRSGDRIGCICDALAEEGYNVALVGIFRAQPYDEAIKAPEDGDYLQFNSFAQDGGVAWFQKQSYEVLGPCVKSAAAFLEEKSPKEPLGVLGFCFGQWLQCKASSTGDVNFACAVGCHPTSVLENAVFGRDEVAMMNGLKQPTLALWAKNDAETYTGEGSCKKAIEKSGGKVEEFPDMLHGWVSRGCVADPAVKAGVESAVDMIKAFFDEHMKQ
uniref:Dienelactone hydrolase domain-containing protein n=1 Tax=Pseudo-nitzschia australis TaxID=44445 RepID=A0A7S4AXH4_9STRA|mmetsp:Transcript_17236/g.37709  ORF Transcript_17236/g.37709 Transcript_17236/m.37709 type:complete len:291 (-) Transcript_17236:84-956(-)|eukprot:CAMPEP_0168167018 /NCGR_PEP_ID=MMETSP0139_2-20121125/2333_1 /TAXON_ID=44445 /ORGANISM="Pseudo-nitzschia australis, Strain 10249 10 AB" /LENGTH=290 /DNA_ID=CAMNT_0008084247 /DNA_START=166 /DNA_END=1038 /DNA_ORIENTATION=-